MCFVFKSLNTTLLFVVAALIYGCASPTALTSKTKELDLSQKSIVLATIEITREGDRAMPWPTRLQVASRGTSGAPESTVFGVDSEGMEYGEDGRHYLSLIRLSLSPGRAQVVDLMGEISAFPFKGIVQVPLGFDFDVPPRSVVYLGRIKLHMRSRRDEDEFQAGPMFPLLSQTALGVSTSTFDISAENAAAIDLPLFKEAFPVLRTVEVTTPELLPFQRQRVSRPTADSGVSIPHLKEGMPTPPSMK